MDNYFQKRTWAEISLGNLKHNYSIIRNHIPEKCKFLGIVKADAYGHGALEVSKTFESCGADYLAVSCLDEALELRNGGITIPILILGHTPSEYTKQLISNNLTQTVTNLAKAKEYSQQAQSLGQELKIHIKLDTGMSRLGFLMDNAVENIAASCSLPNLIAEGIYTHFAVSDEKGEENKAFTLLQYAKFCSVVDELCGLGIQFSLRHCANSGAVVNYPEMCLDMVRPGLLLYGYGDNHELGLKPCMRLVTKITTIKHIPSGSTVSYGRHFTAESSTRIGVLGVGYADGLPRASSNKCSYYANGSYVNQIGAICMDMCMVDLTNVPGTSVGSEIELFGPNNDIYSLANAASTIPYELLCSVTKRVPRIYLENAF